MPSFVLLSTALAPHRAPAALGRTIVTVLALLALVALPSAQKGARKRYKAAAAAAAGAGRKDAGKKDVGKKEPAKKEPAKKEIKPEIRPTPEPEEPAAPQDLLGDWQRITDLLRNEYFARHPDVAFQCGWPKATELGLGAFGEGSGLRWRNALNYARGRLGQLAVADAPLGVRTQVDLLADWIEAELLLLDAQALPMCDPASHVRQAARTLRAATEAEWLPPERRKQEVTELLTQLPAYLAEARLSLLAPSAPWIDLALCDMDDLERIVAELEELLDAPGAEPAARAGARRERAKAAAEPAEKAWTKALVDFRGWLLALSTEARSRPPTLDYAEWTRLVQFTLGRAWNPGEIKARCLRDLAQLELA